MSFIQAVGCSWIRHTNRFIKEILSGLHLRGGGHSPPIGKFVPPLGNFNPSKLNTAHYTHAPPPPSDVLLPPSPLGSWIRHTNRFIKEILSGLHLRGGGHSPPIGKFVPPLGNFNPSKLNTAHYTHAPPPLPTCFCPPPPPLGDFLK